MSTQTRTWQRKILEQASRDNYAGLYWYIEWQLGYNNYASAAAPGKFVPVVPVGPDPETSRHWAHLLAELFRVSNPPGSSFEPALTSIEVLATVPWYVWGETPIVDVVCALCGSVEQVDCELLAMSPAWVCAACAESN